MKIKSLYLSLFIMLIAFVASGQNYEFDEARKKAKQERKQILAYYTASWCMPCKTIKKKVLSNNTLMNDIQEKYIFRIVDIDDLNNYDWIQKNKITQVPTMIVFGKTGKELVRREGVFNADNFREIFINRLYVEEELSNPSVVSTPTRKPVASNPAPRKKTPSNTNNTKEKRGEAMYQPVISSSQSYMVQVGAFREMYRAQNLKRDLETKVSSSVYVVEKMGKNNMIRIVNVGPFNSYKEAKIQSKSLKEIGVDNFVKKQRV